MLIPSEICKIIAFIQNFVDLKMSNSCVVTLFIKNCMSSENLHGELLMTKLGNLHMKRVCDHSQKNPYYLPESS